MGDVFGAPPCWFCVMGFFGYQILHLTKAELDLSDTLLLYQRARNRVPDLFVEYPLPEVFVDEGDDACESETISFNSVLTRINDDPDLHDEEREVHLTEIMALLGYNLVFQDTRDSMVHR